MNNQRIIFPNSEGGVSVFIPAPECELTIEEMATKVVPEGVEFKIVDVSEIPEDRTFRDAWEYDTSDEVVEETTEDTQEEE